VRIDDHSGPGDEEGQFPGKVCTLAGSIVLRQVRTRTSCALGDDPGWSDRAKIAVRYAGQFEKAPVPVHPGVYLLSFSGENAG
jgi:hypothetical protein